NLTSPHVHTFFSLNIHPPPRSTLFPYTTLFRSIISRTVVGIHCRWCHTEFSAIEWLAYLRKLTIHLKRIRALHVSKEIAAHDIQLRIIAPFARISNLVAYGGQFQQRLLFRFRSHPIKTLNVLFKCRFDSVHHLQHASFLSRSEFLRHIWLAQRFAKLLVGQALAALPARLELFGTAEVFFI